MKTLVPLKKAFLKLSLLLAILNSENAVFAQPITVPELVFTNYILESGVAGQDGAQYRFTNVIPGTDAVVEIKGRSSASVVLGSIDTSGPGMGYNKAFQPVLGMNGTAPANTTWSMNFEMRFYKGGTNNSQMITEFNITGIDIDGDGSTLNEWTKMDKVFSIGAAAGTSLTFTNMGNNPEGIDYKIDGIITNSPDIDTTALNVMATYKYKNKNKISFTIGAKTSSSTTTAGMRLNSLWFKEFTLNTTLPVKLVSFTATLGKNDKVELKWTTATEINVSHFTVERSTDGTNFNDAGMVFAYGNTNTNSNYVLSDNISNLQSSIIYYRLRSVDIDGKSEYSDTRIIRINKQTENKVTLVTYPNPVTNELRITIPANWQNKKVVYEVFNANGQTARKIEATASSQTETVNVSNLNSGLYIVKVTCEGQTAQQKIVKQ